MLSMGTMGHGQGSYYVGIAREDYYLAGGEPPGRWYGRGAHALGLEGMVEREPFLRVYHGYAPYSEQALVQNAGEARHRPGFDLTLSAPKSVSTLWAVLPPEHRREIQRMQDEAVRATLTYLEETAAFTRRGHGGSIVEPAKLVAALFEHGTSRAQDPQLHTHALVLGVAVCADGKTRALQARPLFRAKMLAGALFRAELAARMEHAGYAVERHGTSFEVAGVPPSLMETFSKRRAEIEAELDRTGRSGARAAAVAALDTRTVKEHIARDLLFSGWRETAREYDFTAETAAGLRAARIPRDLTAAMRAAGAAAIDRLSQQHSHFSESQLLRAVAEEAPGRGLDLEQTRVAARLAQHFSGLVPVGEVRGEAHYTTPEILELERSLLADVDRMASAVNAHRIPDTVVRQSIRTVEARETAKARVQDLGAAPRLLSEEQLAALRRITQGEGHVACISGMAGTGKTTILDAARQAWTAAGYQCLGAALQGKAARGLQEGAGIESFTLARLLMDLDHPHDTSDRYGREAHRPKLSLNARTVVVLDEAGQVGTRQMAALVAACRRAGARLVCVGDARQLQPIEVGAPFRAMVEEHVGAAELQEIRRQELDRTDPDPYWRREAVRAFADGRAGEALAAYRKRGLIHVSETRDECRRNLIERWACAGTARPGDHLILAGTRAEVRELNRLAQAARRSEGRLGLRSIRIDGETVHERDRVLITANHTRLGVRNGDLGTVERVDLAARRMRLRLDSGTEVSLPCDTFRDLALGYCITVHKSQGATVQNAYVLCGGSMADRELSYVQASRARRDTRFFTERLMVWDPETSRRRDATFEELARQMSRSRQKDLAHSVLRTTAPRHEAEVAEAVPTLVF